MIKFQTLNYRRKTMYKNSQRNITPITSKQEMQLIRDALYTRNPDLVLVFDIIIETGFPLQRLLTLKIKDLINKNKLVYNGLHNPSLVHTEPISKDLQKRLASHYAGRNPEEYAFVGARLGKPLHHMTFNKALENISYTLGIEPAICVTTLQKTFVQNLFKKNPKKAYSHCSAHNPREMYQYLGITPPNDDPADIRTRNMFYSSDVLNATSENFNKVISDISDATDKYADKDSDYLKSVFKFLNSVDSSISTFREETT